MRILHVGNGNQKHAGAKYYDVGTKLTNGLVRAGHHVLFLSDRDLSRALTLFKLKKRGQKQFNDYVLKVCKNYQPEMILLGHADLLLSDSLTQMRRLLPNVKIAQFNVDPVFRPHNVAQITSKLAHVDTTFITTGGSVLNRFSGHRSKIYYMPNPVDPSIESVRAHERTNAPHDVFWAMRLSKQKHLDPEAPRTKFPLFLEENGVDIDYYGLKGRPEVFGHDYFKAIERSKMGINLSITKNAPNSPDAPPEELYLYSSDRISHYMGCGLLTFTTHNNALETLFKPDEEIIFFNDKEELLDKIRFFKAHDEKRQNIAAAGWKKSHEELNATLVARYIIEKTFGKPRAHHYIWPTDEY